MYCTHLRIKITALFFCFCLTSLTFKVNAQTQDAKSAPILKALYKAMGGVEAYSKIHVIQWDFKTRRLYWNKWTGAVRIEIPEKKQVILVNVNTLQGKVFEDGVEVVSPSRRKRMLQRGKNIWINDAYWLVMPWKLEDRGVSLKHLKTETIGVGNKCDVLEVTFANVGVTPSNKYHIYINQRNHLITQWAFFKTATDLDPKFKLPWDNYQLIDGVLLSFNRSKFGPTNVRVFQNFNADLFTMLHYD
jgi:plasmid maintenance system killer protein